MKMNDNTITVIKTSDNMAVLKFKNIIAKAFIGQNGMTINKVEGDRKTPVGEFELGIAFGLHTRESINLDKKIEYKQLTDSMYWVSDHESKFYNKFVDTKEVKTDWNMAEHLIDYKIQYEYAIEIKANDKCIPKKGSAIFIHCENNKTTSGCIAIKKDKMIELLNNINCDTKILIKAN